MSENEMVAGWFAELGAAIESWHGSIEMASLRDELRDARAVDAAALKLRENVSAHIAQRDADDAITARTLAQQRAQLDEQIDVVRSQCATIGELRRRVKELSEQCTSIAAQRDADDTIATASQTELQAQLDEQSNVVRTQCELIDALRRQVKDLGEQHEQLQVVHAKALQQAHELEALRNSMSQRIKRMHLQQRKERRTWDVKQLCSRIREQNQQIAWLSDRLAPAKPCAAGERQRAEVAKLRDALQDSEIERCSERETASECSEQLAACKARVVELETQLVTATEQLGDGAVQLAQLRAEVSTAAEEKTQHVEMINVLNGRIEEADRALEQQTAAAENMRLGLLKQLRKLQCVVTVLMGAEPPRCSNCWHWEHVDHDNGRCHAREAVCTGDRFCMQWIEREV